MVVGAIENSLQIFHDALDDIYIMHENSFFISYDTGNYQGLI
jgi:hypothetical protein